MTPTLKPEVLNGKGIPIQLGGILGKGGEGTVYEVRQSLTTVAKVYHHPLTQDRATKIRAMTKMPSEALSKLTAWPVDILTLRRTGQPIGLIMPRIVDSKNVHHLYGPKSRLKDFPRADWRFLVRAAANIAKAFAVVHESGCVIGDVNHGSIMVAEDATVRLIDCDSFQITTPEGKFLCEVGIETFTPPELQGISHKGVVRTANYDNFGLAVMIFHLLFMGRHPFAGKYNGAGEMPIAKAIKENRFPYGANRKASQMEQPPGTPSLSFVGDEAASKFEAAFSISAIKGGRPTARDWVAVLQKLESTTRQCSSSRGHWHPAHLTACPWCQMEGQGANSLFPFVVGPAPVGTQLNVDYLWRQIQGLSNLGRAPQIPLASASPSAEAIQVGGPSRLAHPIALLLAFAVFLGGTFLLPPVFFLFAFAGFATYSYVFKQMSNDEQIGRFRANLSIAQQSFAQADSDWQNRAGDGQFSISKAKFETLRTELSQLSMKREAAMNKLKQNHRQLQLNQFLSKFDLEDAAIEGIGPGRKRTLESYGIETAEDVVARRISVVPGFGPKMADKLIKWRKSVEAKFKFDPTKAIDARDIARIEQEIQSLRSKIETAIKVAHAEALQAHAQTVAYRQRMRKQMDALQFAVAQAQADFVYVNS